MCLNFVNHLSGRDAALFQRSDEELWEAYAADHRAIFDLPLDAGWRVVNRVPMYSPVFDRDYVNPPVRSESLRNVYLAGNYRTFPSIASTGTALLSGLEAGDAILSDLGRSTDFADRARAYRPAAMPKA